MAGSGLDVVNATLGAAFGVAMGGVLTLVDNVIEGLKFVYHCQEQCTSLREYLEKIKPMLLKIYNQCQSEEALEKWLDTFQKCVEDAQNILEKCRDGSNWERIHEVTYGLQILKLKKEIMENVNMSPMALLTLKSISKYSVGTSVTMQEVPQKILGMEDHFKRIKSTIIERQSVSQSSRCVGIQGMGGSGKTLLAQMVNNDDEIQECFGKNSIFWITVGRDASISSLYVRMREYLHVEISCQTPLEDQRTHLMDVFSKRRVLLVLDDVWDNVHEYKEIVEWLNIARGFGSVTLLTTRNLSVTRRINASVEFLSLLSEEHSWVLFCMHAFDPNQLPSNKELIKLAKDVCNECKGLPLALKIIGVAMKCKDDIAEWRSTLQDLWKSNAMVDKNIEHQLFNRLQISYDQLDEPTKTCFLYFAAYPEDSEIPPKELFQMWVAEDLFGDDLDVEHALDKAHSVLNELRKRSLVDDCKDYLGEACVKMHDILRDLAMHMTKEGDEVVRENLFNPGMKNLMQFPTNWLGNPLKVKRMSLVGQNIKRFPRNFIAPQLGICMINASYYSISLSSLSPSLQECVIEEGFFRNMANIKYMQLRSHANLKTIPTTIGTLRLLQHLDMGFCQALEELPESIGGLGSLQNLNLRYCKVLKELPESIGGLGSLQYLDISQCMALKKLPESIGGLKSLQHLDISECVALKEFPESIGGLGSLQHLDMRECVALKFFPESIGGLGSLQHLDMSESVALKELPDGIKGLGSLQHLDMSACESMEKLSESIIGLRSLQHLNMKHCKVLKELPENIGGLGSLQHLDMSECVELKELPESIEGLSSLQHLNMYECVALEKLPKNIGVLGSLQHLDMSDCVALKELPESIGGLGFLQHLNMSECVALRKLPESIGGLGSLQHLDISECVVLKELPESIGGLRSLQYLDMSECEALKELPESIKGMESLQHLNMSHCVTLKELPTNIGGLGSLKYLNLFGCTTLMGLPESITGLRSLQHLNLFGCTALMRLSESIGGLMSLQVLDLSNCKALKALPKNIGKLGSLQHLFLNSCEALNELPDAIGGLGSLQLLDLKKCEALKELPNFTKNIRLQILF